MNAIQVVPKAAPSGRSILLGCVLSLCGGMALSLSMPRYGGYWPLAFVALVPMIFTQYRLFPRRLSGLAPGLTIGSHWLVALYQMSSIVGLAGIFFGLLFSLGRVFNERSSYKLFMLEMPALWVAVEILRGHSLLLGTSGWLAYDLSEVPALIQPVSLFGTPALSFLILCINGAFGVALLAYLDQRRVVQDTVPVPLGVARCTLFTTLIAAVAWTGVSSYLYARPENGPKVRVAVVQPGTEMTPDDIGESRAARMTREAARQGAQIVVWPEDFLSFDPTTPSQSFVANLARETRLYILTGYTIGKGSNKSALFDPSGQVVGSFHKNHPVILMGEEWDLPRTYPVWPTPLANLGPLICFDLSFPEDTAREAMNGAQLMLIPSFGPASTARDQYHIAQFRAVENRVAVVKADWAWASAIISPNGQVVSYAESLRLEGEQRLMISDVHIGDGQGTFFSRYGVWLGWVFYGIVLVRIAIQVVLGLRIREQLGLQHEV